MPTPRSHGGAPLIMVPMTLPGFKGLNTQQGTSILGPEWATRLENAVIDDSSRLASRKGWDSLTTTPLSGSIEQLVAYEEHGGAVRFVASTATGLWRSSNSGATWTDSTSSLTFTSGNWQFVNFNDNLYGIQQGEDLIVSTGGNFSSITATNVPSGNCLLAAFGRLWAADANGTDLRYSALLNGADWDGSDAGVLDLRNIWPGTDTITALAEFNNRLVVFGTKNIVFFGDNTGSVLGLDPTQAVVVDIISGTGCIARDTVHSAGGGDLWFLSYEGLQSLGRLLVQRSNPLDNLSRNVQDFLLAATVTNSFDRTKIRAVYSPRDRLYILSLPAAGGAGQSIVFDTRSRLEDGSVRCVGTWTLAPTAMAVTRAGALYMSLLEVPGEVGRYAGASDNGARYTFNYESGWLDLTQQGYLLFPKRITGLFFSDNTVSVDYRWAFNFSREFKAATKTFTGSSPAEFGIAEFGIAEYGGGISLRTGNVNASGTGEYIKLGVSASILGTQLAIQQLDLFCKIGRYA
jgi:hypothetical protein